MSRFSKAAAEALGWSFFHESPEVVLRDGNNQSGITKVVPPSVRAEKYLSLPGQDATRLVEEAESIGKLLERIFLFEEHLESRGIESVPPKPKPKKPAPKKPSKTKSSAKGKKAAK